MRKFTIILLLILILYPIESTFGKTPPKFWIRSLEGERFNSSKVKSTYVISFFFVHCPPCIKGITDFVQESKGNVIKFGLNIGLVF